MKKTEQLSQTCNREMSPIGVLSSCTEGLIHFRRYENKDSIPKLQFIHLEHRKHGEDL